MNTGVTIVKTGLSWKNEIEKQIQERNTKKMSFKTAESIQAPIIKFEKIGEVHEGYFIRSRKGKFGILYDFIDEDGKSFTIKSYADIVQKFAIIPEGCYVKITFIDTIKNKQDNPMFVFKIEYDPEMLWNTNGHEEPPPDIQE